MCGSLLKEKPEIRLEERSVVYVKPIWRVVMGVICAIPESIFRKTRIGA